MASPFLPIATLVLLLCEADAIKLERMPANSGASYCEGSSMSFPEFIVKHNRPYKLGTEEYDMRHAAFLRNTEAIQRHKCAPLGPWTAAVNHLADWTRAELVSLRGHRPGRRPGAAGNIQDRMPTFLASRGAQAQAVPTTFSWANLSTIAAPSESQGACGSCWAVASGVAMRARAELRGLPNHFSTEQLIACTLNPHKCGGTGGCDGATGELAFEYVLRAALATDESYRAAGGSSQICPSAMRVASEVATQGVIDADGAESHTLSKTATDLRGMSIGMLGWTKLPENKEEPIMRAVMQSGPVYVAVAAGDHWSWYSSGVMTASGCDEGNVLNHAVVLYAWGVKEKTRIGPVKYWQIKNSWGPNWGEQGSVRLHRQEDEENVCGWDEKPQEGSGCEGGPSKVWVCGTCGVLYDAVAPHF